MNEEKAIKVVFQKNWERAEKLDREGTLDHGTCGKDYRRMSWALRERRKWGDKIGPFTLGLVEKENDSRPRITSGLYLMTVSS